MSYKDQCQTHHRLASGKPSSAGLRLAMREAVHSSHAVTYVLFAFAAFIFIASLVAAWQVAGAHDDQVRQEYTRTSEMTGP